MTSEEIIRRRTEQQAVISGQLQQDGFTEETVTISMLKANLCAFVTVLPFVIVFLVLFFVITGTSGQEFWDGLIDLYSKEMLFGLPLFLMLFLSVPIHEGLHGLGWRLSCQHKWSNIEFGIMKEMLTPYCYCGEAVKLHQYYLGLLLPFLVLGVVISVLGIITGNLFVLLTGLYNLFIAGGDTTIACMLLKYIPVSSRKTIRILDHPSACGCRVFLK